MQPKPLFVFLLSETGLINKRIKTKLCKHQSHGFIFVSETDKYIVFFFFDDKDLQLSSLSFFFFFFMSLFKLRISMNLKKNRIFILQFDLENPRPN